MGGDKQKPIANSSPAIKEFKVNSSCYGMGIPLLWGRNRINSHLLDMVDFYSQNNQTTTSGNGKGASDTVTDHWSYYASFDIALTDGNMVVSVPKVWSQKAETTIEGINGTVLNNTAWGYMSTHHPERAYAYKDISRAVTNFALGENASMPVLTFEGVTNTQFNPPYILDALPGQVITDLLTNATYGAGFSTTFIADLTNFNNACIASGMFISPYLTEQTEAREIIERIAEITNSMVVWTQGRLKFIPLIDIEISGNSITYTSNLTPLYNLTEDDFVGTDEPITLTRKNQADCYNCVTIEYLDRANDYNICTLDVKDDCDISLHGLRKMEPISFHEICETTVARAVAQVILQKQLYVRNTFEFKLGIKHCLLEPGDLVTITDEWLGLNRQLVRIISTEEDESGIKIEAQEVPIGVFNTPAYPTQISERAKNDTNALPGTVSSVVIVNAPTELTIGGTSQLWFGIAGTSVAFGGATVWLSFDNASYTNIGTFNNCSTLGTLTASIPTAASSVDNTSTLTVDLTPSNGVLSNYSSVEASASASLIFVNGELMCYQNAELTTQYGYDITKLFRGRYGTTISAHPTGSQFLKMDNVFKWNYPSEYFERTLYFKFTAHNYFGNNEEDLSSVSYYTYAPGLPPQVTIDNAYVDGNTQLMVHYSYSEPSDFDHYELFVQFGNSNPASGFNGSTWVNAPNDPNDWDGDVANLYWADSMSSPIVRPFVYYGSNLYVSLVAVDYSGNRSTPTAWFHCG